TPQGDARRVRGETAPPGRLRHCRRVADARGSREETLVKFMLALTMAGSALATAVAASAGGNGAENFTTTFHDQTVVFVGTGPFCEFTPPVLITNTQN